MVCSTCDSPERQGWNHLGLEIRNDVVRDAIARLAGGNTNSSNASFDVDSRSQSGRHNDCADEDDQFASLGMESDSDSDTHEKDIDAIAASEGIFVFATP